MKDRRKERIVKKFRMPELLAPVGGWQQLRAAVQNGADAVYMGGPLFNARMKAENFTHDDMREAILYAHDRDVKVYVTINTLIKDSELSRAFSYVNFLYGAGADAVILQDVGLAGLVRRYLPEMVMHMSTQGTIYNEGGALWAARRGFSRIVPARELTLEEIDRVTKVCHEAEEPCEVEVFVHGAMCMCYSGQCHMSRVLGGTDGRSGNRGMCAQPCRLPYTDDSGKTGYLLSPKDMCTIGMLPQICRAGVDSLKIEGRLKSPQYVAVVTSVYRKYLDMYGKTGNVEVSDEDMGKLMSIFNRGGSCEGYLGGNPGADLLSGDSPKNRGIYIGKVIASRKGSTLVDVMQETARGGKGRGARLSMGDGVEIRGRHTTGNVITYIKETGGGRLRIGDIKERVEPGDAVYRVTERGLLDEAERSYGDDFRVKVPVTVRFYAKKGEHPVLEMSDGDICVTEVSDVVAEKALKRPLDGERIGSQLTKLGNTVFRADEAEVYVDDDMNMPISAINDMRRKAVDKLLAERRADVANRTPLTDAQVAAIVEEEKLGDESPMRQNAGSTRGLYVFSRETVEDMKSLERLMAKIASPVPVLYIPLKLFMEEDRGGKLTEALKGKGDVVPYISGVSRGKEDEYIEEAFDDIVRAVRDTGIMVGNPGWIERFTSAGVKVYGDHGLNVYNSQSLKAFMEEGVDVRAYSYEASGYHNGTIPIMITEHPVASKTLTDRKGVAYDVMRWHSGDKYLILGRERLKKGGDSAFMTYVK